MAIHIYKKRVLMTASGKPAVVQKLKVAKFDDFHDFGFDIFDEDAWREFLRNLEVKGKKLESRTKDGDLIVYQVYGFGMKKDFMDYVNLEGNKPFVASLSNCYAFFPTYDQVRSKGLEKNKVKDIIKYGRIDKKPQ